MLKQNRAIAGYVASRASSTHAHPNWLEKGCGNVPRHPQTLNAEVSEMVRGGHAIQVATAKILEAKVADFSVGKSYSPQHLDTLKELSIIADLAVQRINDAVVAEELRFRPSFMIPAVNVCSFVIGCALKPLGDAVSISYLTGVKMAVSDYYNDQIREIHANQHDMVELKELLKTARDEEQQFVDAHTPDVLDPNRGSQDIVTTFAKASLQLLIQAAKIV
ncbi:hypothetical protein CCR75_006248 [Bremia lactucae]|uniref:Ubiquinone biosynthesis protein n=1 Tax=Bremia lactucae TaxID=4779 RepID=A0A976FN31_BRELC|nr:hypothetical protein CCR75_006248 [Bremia lactucae]